MLNSVTLITSITVTTFYCHSCKLVLLCYCNDCGLKIMHLKTGAVSFPFKRNNLLLEKQDYNNGVCDK